MLPKYQTEVQTVQSFLLKKGSQVSSPSRPEAPAHGAGSGRGEERAEGITPVHKSFRHNKPNTEKSQDGERYPIFVRKIGKKKNWWRGVFNKTSGKTGGELNFFYA